VVSLLSIGTAVGKRQTEAKNTDGHDHGQPQVAGEGHQIQIPAHVPDFGYPNVHVRTETRSILCLHAKRFLYNTCTCSLVCGLFNEAVSSQEIENDRNLFTTLQANTFHDITRYSQLCLNETLSYTEVPSASGSVATEKKNMTGRSKMASP